MQVSEAIQRLRTYLDETGMSSGFYNDTSELMTALNDGVREVAKILFSLYRAKRLMNPSEELPEVLKRYLDATSVPVMYSPQMPLPGDCMYVISVRYSVNGVGNMRPCYERSLSERDVFDQVNSFLASTADAPYYHIRYDTIWFESDVTGTGACEVVYLTTPTAATSTSGTLDCTDMAINAVVQFAYCTVLRKDQRTEESLEEYKKFLGMTQQLYM